jgi:hypothetical protein
VPKSHSVDYYVQRAGAGLIISEGTIPSKEGMGWSGAPAIYAPEHVAGWRKVTDAVHAAGGHIVSFTAPVRDHARASGRTHKPAA